MKITQAQYQEFMEHLMWTRLQAPDYRMGQAFLTYFPEVSRYLSRQGKDGTLFEMKLYYETDEERAKELIDQWVTQLDQ
jgi:hypothetical protein